MNRSLRMAIALALSGTGELILGGCFKILNFSWGNYLMALGILSQFTALLYAWFLSHKKAIQD